MSGPEAGERHGHKVRAQYGQEVFTRSHCLYGYRTAAQSRSLTELKGHDRLHRQHCGRRRRRWRRRRRRRRRGWWGGRRHRWRRLVQFGRRHGRWGEQGGREVDEGAHGAHRAHGAHHAHHGRELHRVGQGRERHGLFSSASVLSSASVFVPNELAARREGGGGGAVALAVDVVPARAE